MGFTRNKEDFVCKHCDLKVAGIGYTNHCPRCLWSKHVDIDPGDRAATCLGMMEPISVEGSTGEGYKIRHKCVKCGFEKRNSVSDTDSPDAVVALAQSRKGV